MRKIKISATQDALIIVDLQKDFCLGGALAVPDGDKIVPTINRLIRKFGYTLASKDWHPQNHCSFKGFGGDWPPHCIIGTDGGAFHPDFEIYRVNRIFYKGMDENKDEYSAMRATSHGVTVLGVLKAIGITRIFVTGLATDYCVKATVLDGIKFGFKVTVITDAVTAVNVSPEDGRTALQEMQKAGAKLYKSSRIN